MREATAAEREEFVQKAHKHPLLRAIPLSLLVALTSSGRILELRRNATLIRENEDSHSWYLILSGRCRVLIGSRKGEEAVSELEAGGLVGELAALTGELRAATVAVTSDTCLVMQLPRRTLEEILRVSPGACRYMTGDFVKRIHALEERLRAYRDGGGNGREGDGDDEFSGRKRRHGERMANIAVRATGQLLRRPGFIGFLVFLAVAALMRGLVEFHPPLKDSILFLKGAYLSGLLIFVIASFLLFFTYTLRSQIRCGLAMGLGAGLVVNQLSLLIAFDIFYSQKGSTPGDGFSSRVLFDRSEWVYAAITGIFLIAAAAWFRGWIRFAVAVLGALRGKGARDE